MNCLPLGQSVALEAKSQLPKFLINAGITQNEIHKALDGLRRASNGQMTNVSGRGLMNLMAMVLENSDTHRSRSLWRSLSLSRSLALMRSSSLRSRSLRSHSRRSLSRSLWRRLSRSLSLSRDRERVRLRDRERDLRRRSRDLDRDLERIRKA